MFSYVHLLSRVSSVKTVFFSVFVFLCLSLLSIAHAQSGKIGEFLMFPWVQGNYQSASDNDDNADETDGEAGAIVFFTSQYGKLRVLAELLASTEEVDIERLQIGLSIRPGATVWFGRYHNPVGIWNIRFHHGAYLQTSISRPGISEFIDDGGLLPFHIAGLHIDIEPKDGGSGFAFMAGVGYGPSLDFDRDQVLEEWNFLDPEEEAHGLSSTVRLSYRPDDFQEDEYGIFFNQTKILIEKDMPHDFDGVDQHVFGFFAKLGSDSLSLTTAMFLVENRIELSGGDMEIDSFSNGYLQAEYAFNSDWIFYLRGEGTDRDDDDLYLALFNDFVHERGLGGVRYEIARGHALKLEVSNSNKNENSYNGMVVQWSAVFP